MPRLAMPLGLLLPARHPNRSQAALVRDLHHLGLSPLVFRLRLPHRRPGWLYPAYQALDRRLFADAADPFAAWTPPADLEVADLPTAGWAEALGRIARERSLALLVVPGRLDLPREAATAFSLGILGLDHLDFATGAAPEAFAALAAGAPDWEPRLVWRRAGAPDRLLLRSPSTVMPLSLQRTAAPACVKASRFVGRALAALAADGPEAWETRAEPLAPAPPEPLPDDRTMGRFLPRLLGRHLGAVWRDVTGRPQWFLALRRGDGDPLSPLGYTPLFPPRNRGWADPFPVRRDGRTHLFIEEIDQASGLGSLAVLTEQADGSFSPPRTVLSRPHHLSYPFVFAWDGDMYLVPESGAAASVDLYRARNFPLDWELVGPLLPGTRAVDTTLFPHAGRWWLMTNRREPGASSWDELSLYFADTPLGPFTPHPANPVVSDVRRARPAGRVFVRDGRLLRPSQDCSGHYGRALVFNEITTLTPTAYAERELARHAGDILPGSDSRHTYNAVAGLEVVDGRRFLPRLG